MNVSINLYILKKLSILLPLYYIATEADYLVVMGNIAPISD